MGILGDIGEAFGGWFGGGDEEEEAKRRIQAALDAYGDLSPTDIATLLSETQAGPSAVEKQDRTGMDAMGRALARLEQTYKQQGLTLADRVAQEEATQQARQAERMQRGAIEQEMAARGQRGGGAELAARLSAAQGTANAAHRAGAQAAAAAQGRALQALLASGQLGGAYQGAEAQRSAARDLMSRFNAAQRARAYDTAWNQQYGKAQGEANTNLGAANYWDEQADKERRRYAALGRAGGGAADAGLSWLTKTPPKSEEGVWI